MDTAKARALLDGYVTGPTASVHATAQALEKTGDATAIVLVEGLSDQIALETLALRRGWDLAARRVVVVPVGGAHGVGRYLRRFGNQVPLTGLCDAAEEPVFRVAVTDAGLGAPTTRAELAGLGFHVCDADLEDELIRAIGAPAIEALLDAYGDLGAFRTLQHQAAWRDRPAVAQLRRWLGSGARRKLRYARLLVETVPLDRVPPALDAVLTGPFTGPAPARPPR